MQSDLKYIREVLESDQWGGFHPCVAEFEQRFAAFQHCRHGVSCANGTLALELALVAAGIGPGDEVLVPAISFISTATAVSRVGATPVFVDIEPDTFNIDPERARAAIGPRTRAVIPVHFAGVPADMDRLLDVAQSNNLLVIEDAAHAHGSEWKNKRAGSFGLASIFSFQNSKVMTCGEGGILLTNDDEVAARARSIANQGRLVGGGWFEHHLLGSNFRLSALQAAVLLPQLERLPGQIEKRRTNEELLRSRLADVEGLVFQRVPPQVTARSHYLLLGHIDPDRFGMSRDEFRAAMVSRGIPCTPFYPHPLYTNPVYQRQQCRAEPCPVAEARVRDAFWFPHRVLMAEEEDIEELARIIRTLKS